MSLADELPVRGLADRVLRDSLLHPENLRTFLGQAVPALAGGFDCGRARLLDREFPLDDWRHREADLPFEIPYRLGAEEVWVLVCLLLEHQSDTDPLMPLRLLYLAVVYWDKQWRAWENSPRPRPPLRLNPVLPVVLYTGDRPWGSNKSLADMLGEPKAFHAFAPTWQPLFWNLADRSPQALLEPGRKGSRPWPSSGSRATIRGRSPRCSWRRWSGWRRCTAGTTCAGTTCCGSW